MSSYQEWCVGRGPADTWVGRSPDLPVCFRCNDTRPHGAHYFYPPTPDPLCPCEFCQGAKP